MFCDKKRVSKLQAVLTLFAFVERCAWPTTAVEQSRSISVDADFKPGGKLTAALSCSVDDPTGTPLNVRSEPAGKIIASLPNGSRVKLATIARDRKGSEWARISFGDISGWVLRAHLSCS